MCQLIGFSSHENVSSLMNSIFLISFENTFNIIIFKHFYSKIGALQVNIELTKLKVFYGCQALNEPHEAVAVWFYYERLPTITIRVHSESVWTLKLASIINGLGRYKCGQFLTGNLCQIFTNSKIASPTWRLTFWTHPSCPFCIWTLDQTNKHT